MQAKWSDGPEFGGGIRVPPMTSCVKRILIGTGIVFLLQVFLAHGRSSPMDPWLGINPPLWRSILFPFWQLVTYGFLHDVGNFGHILWNMLILYFFGTSLEGIVGPRRFFVFYMASMVAGGLLQLLASIGFGWNGIVIGASGAVLGVTIALAVMQPRATMLFLFIPLTMKTFALIIVAKDVFGILLELRDWFEGAANFGGVAHFAHIGGALFGFLAVRLGWIWRDPMAAVRRRAEVRQVQSESDRRREIDKLLEKIQREGIQSLTGSEKRFLKRSSKR